MNSRMIFLISAILVSSFAFSWAAQGDESFSLDQDGVKGRWFPQLMVDQIQKDLLELDAKRKTVVKLNVELDIRMKRIDELKLAFNFTNQALAESEKATSIAERTMTDAAQRAALAEELVRAAEDAANAWYRHPTIWACVGVVLTVVVELIVWGVVS